MSAMRWFCLMVSMGCLLFTSGCTTVEVKKRVVPFSGLKDGVYEGEAVNGSVKAVVSVAVEDQMIRGITLSEHRTVHGVEAGEIIPIRILKKQSTSVDVVSGATLSSKAIMSAVQNAVDKARKYK